MFRKIIHAYTSFTRTERMGIVALLALLLILVLIRTTMQYWVAPPDDPGKQKELVASWEAFKAKAVKESPRLQKENIYKQGNESEEKRTDAPDKPTKTGQLGELNTGLFPFDPNTIDSAGLRKLGLKEKTTSIFLHWRAKGKKFYNKEELKKLYTLTEEEYLRLEPYIVIDREKLK